MRLISSSRTLAAFAVVLVVALAACATGEQDDPSVVDVPDRSRDVPDTSSDLPADDPDLAAEAGDLDALGDPVGDPDAVETDRDAQLDPDGPEDDGGGGPVGEQCGDATLLAAGTHSFDSAGFSDDYNAYGGNCGGLSAPGPDVVFRVAVPPNSTLQVSLTPGPGYDAALLITSSCENMSGLCLEASDDAGPAGAENVTVYNTTGSTLTWFLVVDAGSVGATGSYTLVIGFE